MAFAVILTIEKGSLDSRLCYYCRVVAVVVAGRGARFEANEIGQWLAPISSSVRKAPCKSSYGSSKRGVIRPPGVIMMFLSRHDKKLIASTR